MVLGLKKQFQIKYSTHFLLQKLSEVPRVWDYQLVILL